MTLISIFHHPAQFHSPFCQTCSCPSRMRQVVECPKLMSTQPRCTTTCLTLYKVSTCLALRRKSHLQVNKMCPRVLLPPCTPNEGLASNILSLHLSGPTAQISSSSQQKMCPRVLLSPCIVLKVSNPLFMQVESRVTQPVKQ